MCLTIPGRIAEIDDRNPAAARAIVDYSGLRRSASLLFLPEARVGDYVLVQSGFVTTRLEEEEALEALAYAKELDSTREGTRVGSSPSQ